MDRRNGAPVAVLTVLTAAAVVLVSRTAAGASPPAPLYGNMPVSLDPTVLPLQFHFETLHIGSDSNLLALHMEWFGIPWDALASGGPLPRAWAVEIDRADAVRKSLGLPVYLAVTPISGTRDRLAARASGDGGLLYLDNDFGARCENVAARSDIAGIRRAYHALVDLLVARFQPRFLALSVEVNLYSAACSGGWPSMRDLLNTEYRAQKTEHPGLMIFHTFQLDSLWAADQGQPCFGFDRSCLVANVARLADLQSDLWALSTYPVNTFLHNGRRLPADYIAVVGELTGQAIAIAETGYLTATYSAAVSGTCLAGLPSSPQDQAWWMDRVLSDATRLSMPFVVWFSDQAWLPFDDLKGCGCSDGSDFCGFLTTLGDGSWGVRFFGLMALRDHDGSPTPALELWHAAVAAAQPRSIQRPLRSVTPRSVLPR